MSGNISSITTIALKPDEVWKYSREHKKQLEESLVSIASSRVGNCEVFLTIDKNSTMIYVFQGENLVHEEAIISDEDAETAVSKIYTRYLPDGAEQDGECSREELEDDMYERESELCSAMEDFLNVAVEGFYDAYFADDADIAQELVDSVCRLLAVKRGISVRYPRFEYDKDGGESYVEFPYEFLASS